MKKTFAILFTVIFFNLFSHGQDATTYKKTGDKAPEFSYKTIDGKTIDISTLKGKVILVNFFATWCPPCNQELPVLQKKVWERYMNSKDFVLIILGREHSEEELIKWVKEKGYSMPFAPDPERKIYSMYAKESIPRNVIIGKDGKIAFQSIGFTEEEFKSLEDKLAELLK